MDEEICLNMARLSGHLIRLGECELGVWSVLTTGKLILQFIEIFVALEDCSMLSHWLISISLLDVICYRLASSLPLLFRSKSLQDRDRY